jgi:tetratricopeptide (TPR) repeat protein
VDLAGFSSDAPVNTASHFPPPKDDAVSWNDPFDMSAFSESLSRTRYHTSPGHLETAPSTDDILGVLSQPVESFRKPSPPPAKPATPVQSQDDSGDEADTERDRAIAAIVEMGFTVGQATKALSATPSGTDVELALNDLLSRPSSSASARLERPPIGRRRTPDSARRTPDSSARPEQPPQKDLAQIAGEVGTSLLKGAGSLWKSGREKMNSLIQEYQGDQPDPSVPKWMRDQQKHASRRTEIDEGGDDARVLETREQRSQQRTQDGRLTSHHPDNLRPTSARDRLALKKQAEDEADTNYRSSARRRAPPRTGTPSSEPVSRTATPPLKPIPVKPNIDLFNTTTDDIPTLVSRTPQTSSPAKPARPVPPIRTIPPTSPTALSSSHASRQKGSEAFKLGDYSQALTYYTSALTPLPETHPQRIIILSNRAITNLKLGDAKAAITDCDTLLSNIGPSRGDGEKITDMEGEKSMKDIWEKGVMRRAQGLEMLEKYNEALEMWKVAIDAGVGGGVALEGRRRCERALGVKSAPAVSARNGITTRPAVGATRPIPKLSPSKPPRPSGPSAAESLAKYHADLAAEDKEKAGLYDTVDTKVATWYNGKESNLRALLSSLDLILWPETGWKKVSMAELVLPNKVKIVYMRAVAKVHPDKVVCPLRLLT